MIPDKIRLEIATPERLLVTEDVDEVVLPSVEGYMGVLPGHAPLLALLQAGEISYRVGKQLRFFSVSGGFVEVLRESVKVLAETCEPAEEIDVQRARRAKERAEAALRDRSESEFAQAEVNLKRAISRIQVHERIGQGTP